MSQFIFWEGYDLPGSWRAIEHMAHREDQTEYGLTKLSGSATID